MTTSEQRRGKIARLPRSIREQLNVRLDDGQDAAQILPWLNALPEVRDSLARHFNGAPISAQNLSAWRQGGFNEWLLLHQVLDSAERMGECADDLSERLAPDCPDAVPRKLADNMLTHLSARLAAFIAGWDGAAPSPEMEVILKLSQYIIKLQRALCQTERHDFEMRQREQRELDEDLKRERLFGIRASIKRLPWPDDPAQRPRIRRRANSAANG
jgi:hypothetical protein